MIIQTVLKVEMTKAVAFILVKKVKFTNMKILEKKTLMRSVLRTQTILYVIKKKREMKNGVSMRMKEIMKEKMISLGQMKTMRMLVLSMALWGLEMR